MTTVSVIIITKNEQQNIEDCLRSVAWADEIIVVDSGSTDSTVEIARKYTDKVLVTDWPGYGAQKQRALNLATKEWVLSLDADERVTDKLKAEILKTLPNTHYAGFEIPFTSEYCGKLIRFGDWWHDSQAVLFKRTQGKMVALQIHERIEITGAIGKMKHPIYHYAFRNLTSVLNKMNDYSSRSAEQKYQNGKKASLWTALSHALWTFFRGYFLRLGFLDGVEGFILAVSNSEGTYYRYLKLRYLTKQKKH